MVVQDPKNKLINQYGTVRTDSIISKMTLEKTDSGKAFRNNPVQRQI